MVVFDLSYGLAEMGHQVYIAAGEGNLINEIDHPNIHFVHIPIERIQGNTVKQVILYINNCISAYLKLKKLVREERINIINSHQPIPNIYARILSKKMKIPFVTTSHNVYKKNCLTKTYVSGNHVIACSDKVYDNSIRHFNVSSYRISCVRNGINPARLKSTNPIIFSDKFVIGTLAGLRKQKSLDNLIKAFYIFHKRVPNSILVIAGEGKEKHNLQKIASELEIKNEVVFLGFKDNASDVFSGLNIFALSSEYEGLPISMLEAMAMKVPVVVTAVGGIPWVIKNKVNGIICDYGNVDQMAESFYSIYKNKNYSSTLANNGYQTVISEFSYKKMAKQYLDIYKMLMS